MKMQPEELSAADVSAMSEKVQAAIDRLYALSDKNSAGPEKKDREEVNSKYKKKMGKDADTGDLSNIFVFCLFLCSGGLLGTIIYRKMK